MERLALIGVSQRRGGTQALEAWTSWVQGLQEWPASLVGEVVPILTCNRCDLVLALPETVSLEQLRSALLPLGSARGYAFAGEAALEQLCRVAASLDSLNPGEDQIMNQVRSAFEEAKQARTIGFLTSFAFQTALRIAKRVRREIALAPGNTSLFSLAKPEMERILPPRARVAVLGAGEMGTLAARSLAATPNLSLLIVNRTLEKAQSLAAELGAEAMGLEAFLHEHPLIDGLVCATPIEHLIDASILKHQPGLRVIVDLGLPQNVNPGAAHKAGVVHIGLEAMQALGEERRLRLRQNLAQAEQVITEEIEVALGEWAERQLGAAITHLRQQYRATLEQMVGELLEEATIARLANRFAYLPIKGLRGLVRRNGLEAAQVFLEEAGLDNQVSHV